MLDERICLFHLLSRRQAGQKYVRLHGCVSCNNKVWEESDVQEICPNCGAHRFDDKGKPKEFIIWFPFKERFASLLRTEKFVESVKWEGKRVKANPDYVTGISCCVIVCVNV